MRLVLVAALAVMLGCATTSRRVGDQASEPRRTSCANNPAIDATDYDTTQVTERPILRRWTQIHYPDEARRSHIAGRVVIAAVIGTNGMVDRATVRIVNSVDYALDTEAKAFVIASAYWPACLNGKAVRVRVAIPIDFKINR